MAEGGYEFRPRPLALSQAELQAALRVAPPPEALANVRAQQPAWHSWLL